MDATKIRLLAVKATEKFTNLLAVIDPALLPEDEEIITEIYTNLNAIREEVQDDR